MARQKARKRKSSGRTEREQQIFEAAYQVLEAKGYKGASMLAIARAASASNETMYAWFSSKAGLMKAMAEANADAAASILDKALQDGSNAIATLQQAGPELIRLFISDRATALNRAAAADASEGGELGQVISRHGRDTIRPMLVSIFERAQAEGSIGKQHDAVEVAEIYIALLIGDSQIRRVIGVAPEPARDAVEGHSERGLEILQLMYGN